jgi:methionyl-tRNA synthetase
MSESIVLKNEERKKVVLDEKTLVVCPSCSEYYGRFEIASNCTKCNVEFQKGREVVCSEGRHFCRDCFEEMEKNGEVEEEVKSK